VHFSSLAFVFLGRAATGVAIHLAKASIPMPKAQIDSFHKSVRNYIAEPPQCPFTGALRSIGRIIMANGIITTPMIMSVQNTSI
jgi:hypothetical protein